MSSQLTLDELEEMREAVLANARNLVEEAQMLLDAGRVARVFTLSQLASEELAKLPMLTRALVELASGATVDWKRLHKRLRDHVEKSNLAIDLDFFRGDITAEEFLALDARELNHLKNASLYVGISAQGVERPEAVITKGLAEKSLRYAGKRLAYFEAAERLIGGRTSASIAGFLCEIVEEVDTQLRDLIMRLEEE